MEIVSINISKPQFGANHGKYSAAIKLHGGSNYPADINIGIPDEMLQPIVGIIQQAVVDSMARSAAEFAENVAASLSPTIEHEQIEDASAEQETI
ncbi:hypothetical protein [Croceibacterium aestuarii]|uniref:hypothetical protein n=1 Tax=Croceibacterium aestuarii TaxID=3064139 RepID=UPI00272E766E|nr:hypothetical protein [Croceibacterium sp. D39]